MFGIKIELKRAAPGVVLSLFGVIILVAGLIGMAPGTDDGPTAPTEKLVCSAEDSSALIELRNVLQAAGEDRDQSGLTLVVKLAHVGKNISEGCLNSFKQVLSLLEFLESGTQQPAVDAPKVRKAFETQSD